MNVNPDPFRLQVGRRPEVVQERDQWTIASIVEVALRRRGLVALVAALTVALAIAYVALATPSYTSEASVIIDTKLSPPSPGQVASDVTIDPAVVDSQVEILKSNKIALDVVDRLNLATDPEFIGHGPSPMRAALDRVLGLFETRTGPPLRSDPRQAAAAALTQKVKILRTGRSILAEITVTTFDPQKSADIANAIADAYIQDQLSSRMEASQRTTDWMQRRLSEVRERMVAADAALKAFRERTDGAQGDAAQLEGSRASAATRLDQARGALDRASRPLAALERGAPDAGTLAAIEALNDPALSRLAAAAGGNPGPDAVAGLTERLRAIVETGRKAVAAAELRTTLLDKQIQDLATAGAAAPSKRAQDLERTAQETRGNYDAMQNRVTRVSAFLQQQSMPVTEARVVTVALPPLGKSAPKTTLILLLSIVGGLCAGVAAAFLRDAFDHRVRWPQQITHTLGQPFLGPLATCKGRSREFRNDRIDAEGGGRSPFPLFITNGSGSPTVLETLRSIKVALDQALRREDCRVVGVISANEGEGKTTLTANLAVLLVEMRARVLVIDADLHGQNLHGQGPHGQGLTFLADGDPGIGLARAVTERRPLTEAVVQSQLGFDLLPGVVGTPPAHPVEILASAELRRLLAEARDRYDYVVVEVPAVLSAVDARVVSDLIDAFVMVLNSGRTRIDDVEHAFASCPAVADRLTGIVMNRSKLGRRRGRAKPTRFYAQGVA